MSKKNSHGANSRRQRRKNVQMAKAMSCQTQNISSGRESKGIVIFKSELDYISSCILDRKNIETGGQLFGYWTEEGRPVVMYAIGPGPRANHQPTFFNQDVNYLVTVGRVLKETYGLHHIGEWHSHHQLGLARPSGHDVNTMVSTIRDKGLGKFLLCIGNCTPDTASLKGYFCDSSSCRYMDWEVISSQSPVRKDADHRLAEILNHPAPERDRGTAPDYAEGYWLQKQGNGVILNDIMNYLRRKYPRADVKAQMNPAGEVVLSVIAYRDQIQIRFPRGFPEKAPEITYRQNGRTVFSSKSIYWIYTKGDITRSFIYYFESL